MSSEPAYQPSSRRPIADIFRLTAHGAVKLCLKLGISADAVSYASMVAAAGAALCLLFVTPANGWPLLLVPVFLYLRLWLNMLDGMVALASGKASLRGEILNEVPDRISDILIFVGVANLGWLSSAPWGITSFGIGTGGAITSVESALPTLHAGYAAALAAVFTAYIGIFGQAVGVQREFSGVMSKQWRMVALHLGCWTAYFSGEVWLVLQWTCWLVVFGCLQTIWVRLRRILSALEEKKKNLLK